ncbi:MAG: acyl-CoA dehydratase activase [bacterium]
MMVLGIDIGASAAKGIILDDKQKVVSSHVRSSGVNFEEAAEQTRAICLRSAGIAESDVRFTVATGYGRRNVAFADETRTEISCHAKGGYFHHPGACTIVDIGGQDSKVIRVDDTGRPFRFKMNRKCAAGTGAFLEEIAARMAVPLDELDTLARNAQKEIELGSFCTVFTKTEILARIAEGAQAEDIAKGIFSSVIKRIMEMDPLSGHIVITGGVIAHNPYLGEMFEQKLNKRPFIPPLPQFAGALGAALYSLEKSGG